MFLAVFMLLTIIISSISNIVFAKTVGNDAFLQNRGDCGYHLTLKKCLNL